MNLVCPVCGGQLNRQDKRLSCLHGHSFDVARQGYVNLLSVQHKHSRNPGDTREQVLSRREFLEGEHYRPICDCLVEAARELGITGPILDVGCGEGYYGTRLADALGARLIGLDISKEAVRCAAGKYKGSTWLCATASRIPLEAASVQLVTSLFALTQPEEYARVLKPGGYFFQVLAQQDHLLGLKQVIYDQLTVKQKDTQPDIPGFDRVKTIPIRFSFTVQGRQIRSLFSMTPHLYRVGKAGMDRLEALESLTDTASCVLNVYRLRD